MMNEAARRAPALHRRVHGAAAALAAMVAAAGVATGAVGVWTTAVAAIAAVLLAAEAVTCRCLVEDVVRPAVARVAGWRP